MVDVAVHGEGREQAAVERAPPWHHGGPEICVAVTVMAASLSRRRAAY